MEPGGILDLSRLDSALGGCIVNRMARVVGLGHIGIYVRDLERMTSFYRDFLGMTVTKQAPGRAVFLSSDPQLVDHEIALMTGRNPEQDHNQLIQQISLRVPSLEDLRTFKKRILENGYKIDQIVTHLSAIGCYFFDPEGNRTEVFWLTGRPSWIMIGVPIDIDRSDAEIMADIDRVWEQTRHVSVGMPPDEAAQQAMQRAYADVRKQPVPA
jgi:catechol 2,3-dioxygenase